MIDKIITVTLTKTRFGYYTWVVRQNGNFVASSGGCNTAVDAMEEASKIVDQISKWRDR
jgi:hypothetical protein